MNSSTGKIKGFPTVDKDVDFLVVDADIIKESLKEVLGNITFEGYFKELVDLRLQFGLEKHKKLLIESLRKNYIESIDPDKSKNFVPYIHDRSLFSVLKYAIGDKETKTYSDINSPLIGKTIEEIFKLFVNLSLLDIVLKVEPDLIDGVHLDDVKEARQYITLLLMQVEDYDFEKPHFLILYEEETNRILIEQRISEVLITWDAHIK